MTRALTYATVCSGISRGFADGAPPPSAIPSTPFTPFTTTKEQAL